MTFLAAIIGAYVLTALVFATLTALEVVFPHGERPFRHFRRGLLFWLVWIPVSVASFQAGGLIAGWVGITPIVTLRIGEAVRWTGVAAIVLGPILGAIFADFFFYWFHRAQHRWFWRFHAVHHSIRDLSAINSYHHITETALRVALTAMPMSLIVTDVGPTSFVVVLLLQLQIFFLHSPTRANFGPLRYLIADNRYHRIHHSLDEEHFDKNFAATAPLWDVLFGTAYFPAKHEWPDVGIAEIGEPQSVREYLDLPIRYRPQPHLEAVPAE